MTRWNKYTWLASVTYHALLFLTHLVQMSMVAELPFPVTHIDKEKKEDNEKTSIKWWQDEYELFFSVIILISFPPSSDSFIRSCEFNFNFTQSISVLTSSFYSFLFPSQLSLLCQPYTLTITRQGIAIRRDQRSSDCRTELDHTSAECSPLFIGYPSTTWLGSPAILSLQSLLVLWLYLSPWHMVSFCPHSSFDNNDPLTWSYLLCHF